jgi:hypothetical protein
MEEDGYELLSVEDMRRKYGLVAANRPTIRLDPSRVPEGLRHLVPYAELWGVGDDLIRDDLVSSAPPEAIEELQRVVRAHDHLLDEWLAGPEAEAPDGFSEEYLAFTCMRMAADGV